MVFITSLLLELIKINCYKEGNLIKRNQCDKNITGIRTQRWPTAQITKTQECWAKSGELNFKVTEQQRTHSFHNLGMKQQYKRYSKSFPLNLLNYMFVIPN